MTVVIGAGMKVKLSEISKYYICVVLKCYI